MSKKRKFSVVISLVLCMSILFSGTVFASGESHETAIPGDMEVVATITDEFNNVTNVDVEYTVEEVPNMSRTAGVKSYVLRAVTSEIGSNSNTKDGVSASITIYYDKQDSWFPGDSGCRINTVAGQWSVDSQKVLSNKKMHARDSVIGVNKTTDAPAFSFQTGFTSFVGHGMSYASTEVTINSSSILSVEVTPNW